MIKKINDDLNQYISEHLKYQMISLKLSNDANQKGFPGFAHFYQVESADALVHIRKIANYLMDQDAEVEIKDIKVPTFTTKNIEETLKKLKSIKEELLEFTNKLVKSARDNNDNLTAKFYDWFLIDFYEEIAFEKDLLDWIAMSNSDLYKIDKRLGKTPEPDTLKVIVPFYEPE